MTTTLKLRHPRCSDMWKLTPEEQKSFIERETGREVRDTYCGSGLWYTATLDDGTPVVVYGRL